MTPRQHEPTEVHKDVGILADGLVDVREAANFLAVSRAMMYKILDNGDLPYCKIGRSRRIPRRALIEYASSTMTRQP
jgi:excisionase family DNA binding protein